MSKPTKPPLSLPEFVALFSLTTSLTALSIDAMLPALRDIGTALAVAEANDTQLIVGLFILGMVFGEIVFGPLSDAIGRKPAILVGLALFGLGAVVAMEAETLEQILIGRVIQGIGCAGPKIAARALIRDQYEGRAMARILSFIFMVFIIVPMLAPALGQLVLAVADWRAIFLVFRSEEPTSELQSLMRISYAGFFLKKKKKTKSLEHKKTKKEKKTILTSTHTIL